MQNRCRGKKKEKAFSGTQGGGEERPKIYHTEERNREEGADASKGGLIAYRSLQSHQQNQKFIKIKGPSGLLARLGKRDLFLGTGGKDVERGGAGERQPPATGLKR